MTGTWTLLRLAARRDRVRGVLWVLGLAAFVPYVLTAYATLFPTREDLRGVLVMLTGPLGAVMVGPGHGLGEDVTRASLFAGVYWPYLLVGVAVMNLLLVPRHTRAEEEAGRAGLVRAGAVGPAAPLAAALLHVAALDVALGVLVAVGLAALAGLDPAETAVPLAQAWPDALLLGVTTAAFGMVVAGVAALLAQAAGSAAGAAGLAGALVALAFVARAVGDTAALEGDEGLARLSWASPFHWAQETRPFADARWWPAGLLLGLAVVCALVALGVAVRRDVGSALLHAGRGRRTAGPAMRGPVGLAGRLHRGGLLAWLVGLAAFAAAYGALTRTVVDALADLPPELSVLLGGGAGAGGADAAVHGYLSFVLLLLCVFCAVAGVAGLRVLAREEETGRAALVLATATGRARWLAAHLGVVLAGTLLLHVAVGAALGATARAALGASGGAGGSGLVGEAVLAALAAWPATALLVALGAALWALHPRLAPLVWLPVVAGFLLETFGALLDVPDAVRAVSVWHHVPRWAAGGPTVTGDEALALAVQGGLAVVLLALALAALRRRDLRG